MRQINMLDLHGEYGLFADEIRGAVSEVLDSQRFIGGAAISQLEESIAKKCGVAEAIAVSSGTDALICTLMAMGIGRGDEVIIPAFTFFATAGSVYRVGAKPVFIDIDPRTFNMDPAEIEALVTDRTKAIIPVHLFGQCAEMDAINAVVSPRGIRVIEDAAQALGAKYHGRCAGSIGDAACLSFYPTKNLGGFGEGGMVLTNDTDLARVVRQLRNHGESERYVHDRVGGNFRLDTMKAAILLVKLRYLDEFTSRRRNNAACYDAVLKDFPLTTPYVKAHQEAIWHQYTILSDTRNELSEFLKGRGVGSGVYYAVPLHLQKCFASLGYSRGALPVTERICNQVLSLPCHPMLSEDDIRYVGACIGEFHQAADGSKTKPAARTVEA